MYKKLKIQAPGTTFSTVSDEVRPEGEDEKCCRFGTLTGVHQGAHICHAKFWFDGKTFGARGDKRKVLVNKTAADVLPIIMCLLSGLCFFCVSGAVQNTGGKCSFSIYIYILPLPLIRVKELGGGGSGVGGGGVVVVRRVIKSNPIRRR